MFEKRDARDGPTRLIAVNQRMFVRNSGPITANARQIHISVPKWKVWLAVCRSPVIASGIQPKSSTSELIRNGE